MVAAMVVMTVAQLDLLWVVRSVAAMDVMMVAPMVERKAASMAARTVA